MGLKNMKFTFVPGGYKLFSQRRVGAYNVYSEKMMKNGVGMKVLTIRHSAWQAHKYICKMYNERNFSGHFSYF